MSEAQVAFVFGGPPPPRGEEPGIWDSLVTAMRASPGEWAQVDCGYASMAHGRRGRFAKLGFEAVTRGKVLYVRVPLETPEVQG